MKTKLSKTDTFHLDAGKVSGVFVDGAEVPFRIGYKAIKLKKAPKKGAIVTVLLDICNTPSFASFEAK